LVNTSYGSCRSSLHHILCPPTFFNPQNPHSISRVSLLTLPGLLHPPSLSSSPLSRGFFPSFFINTFFSCSFCHLFPSTETPPGLFLFAVPGGSSAPFFFTLLFLPISFFFPCSNTILCAFSPFVIIFLFLFFIHISSGPFGLGHDLYALLLTPLKRPRSLPSPSHALFTPQLLIFFLLVSFLVSGFGDRVPSTSYFFFFFKNEQLFLGTFFFAFPGLFSSLQGGWKFVTSWVFPRKGQNPFVDSFFSLFVFFLAGKGIFFFGFDVGSGFFLGGRVFFFPLRPAEG